VSDLKSTLKTIKSAGYWVFHVKPTRRIEVKGMDYEKLRQLVIESSVQLRGWDVPHVPMATAENQDLYNIDNGLEAWCDLGFQKEVWRLYFDGEFILYVALDEDWYGQDGWTSGQPPFNSVEPKSVLNPIGGVIFHVTEMLEFVKRLVAADFLHGEVHIHIELRNVIGRRLDLLDPRRVPFHSVYASRQNEITALDENLSVLDLRRHSTEIAGKAILKVLNMFQWNSISAKQIAEEQEKLFKREFY
jgi:hypothetical protein